MAVKLRLMRMGKKKQPTYRVVAADSRSPRDGRFIEIVGVYDPRPDPSAIRIDNDRAVDWLRKGAQPTESVRKLLEISGAWETFSAEGAARSAPADAPAQAAKSTAKSTGTKAATESTAKKSTAKKTTTKAAAKSTAKKAAARPEATTEAQAEAEAGGAPEIEPGAAGEPESDVQADADETAGESE